MQPEPPLEEASPIEAKSACLGRDEECPLCGGDNRCREAKGYLYKGPCWCHGITAPKHILDRLALDRLEPACLCRSCLESIAELSAKFSDTKTILAEIRLAVAQRHPNNDEQEFYLDKGNVVFTAAYHLKRGSCCRNGCRHCPY